MLAPLGAWTQVGIVPSLSIAARILAPSTRALSVTPSPPRRVLALAFAGCCGCAGFMDTWAASESPGANCDVVGGRTYCETSDHREVSGWEVAAGVLMIAGSVAEALTDDYDDDDDC